LTSIKAGRMTYRAFYHRLKNTTSLFAKN